MSHIDDGLGGADSHADSPCSLSLSLCSLKGTQDKETQDKDFSYSFSILPLLSPAIMPYLFFKGTQDLKIYSHAASQVISPDKSAAAASEGKNKLAVETKSTSGIVDVTAAINALMAGADDTAGNALQPRSVNNSHESSDVVSPQTAQRKKWSVDKDPKFSVTVAESAPSSAALVQEQVFAQAKVPVCWFLPP